MTTFTWKVNNLTSYNNYEGRQDVVYIANWTCRGEETVEGNTFTAEQTRYTNLRVEITGSFTPFEQLTEEQVLNWIWNSGSSKDVVELAVQKEIDIKKNPPVALNRPVPWQTN